MKRLLLSFIAGCLCFAGNSQQFSLIKDINPGTATSNICYLTSVGNTLYFGANDGINGMELWKSDGTAGGTVLVKDINPGAASCGIGYLTNVNGILFFVADNGTTGVELWKSDGTAAGTVLVKNIRSGSMGSNPSDLINVNGVLFFAADDGVNGQELWKSNGTTAGTVLVKNINPAGGSGNVQSLANVNGQLFFAADNGVNGEELWKSDGTSSGTTMVKDIQPGAAESYPFYLTKVGSNLFFAADNGTDGVELWKSNGTSAGTVLVKDIRPGSEGSNPLSLKSVADILFFSADNGINGIELWKSDGTASGTGLVKDIWPGASDGTIGNFAQLVNRLIFVANDGVNGDKTWQSDGSASGTTISTITTGGNGQMRELVETQSKVFASISQTDVGSELWAINFSPVLPLHILTFSGTLIKQTVSLEWTTTDEEDLKEFVIERSENGKDYSPIGKVHAKGTIGTKVYSFVDGTMGQAGALQYYYRLQQVDIYGRSIYSKILVFSLNNLEESSVYPNPAKDQINIEIVLSRAEEIRYEVLDCTGRMLMRGEKKLAAGRCLLPLDISRYPNGVYFISVYAGSINKQSRFIKK